MDQVLAIQKIQKKIDNAISFQTPLTTESMLSLLDEIRNDLNAFLDQGVDFKDVVEAIDDSILITDCNGKIIYVNCSYEKNTGIMPEELLGRNVKEIVEEGKLFTGGAVLDVIKTQKKAFRLSNVNKTTPSSVGYVVGVPIFDGNGKLYQVVASSRPILSLKALQEDFDRFLKEANALRESAITPKIISNSTNSSQNSNRLIGDSSALKKVWSTILKAAPTDASVLITGESGVGKEIVADEVCRLSLRNKKTFIKVNCASIPLNLLESELFGYEKGAFSGANSSGKQGLFEMANGGTLLLDEIGDMPMDLQVKLLRAIQNKEITRVGGTKPIQLDIRFISSTNCDLKKKMCDGTFRMDLFYRLNVIPLQIPPLREHKEDLELLCNFFLDLFGKKHNRKIYFNEEHLNILRSYNWPGNVRELENVIEYLTICSSGTNSIDEEMLRGILDISPDSNYVIPTTSLSKSMEMYEKSLIESVLSKSKSLRDAGSQLGVNASTICRKIKQYEIKYPK